MHILCLAAQTCSSLRSPAWRVVENKSHLGREASFILHMLKLRASSYIQACKLKASTQLREHHARFTIKRTLVRVLGDWRHCHFVTSGFSLRGLLCLRKLSVQIAGLMVVLPFSGKPLSEGLPLISAWASLHEVSLPCSLAPPSIIRFNSD